MAAVDAGTEIPVIDIGPFLAGTAETVLRRRVPRAELFAVGHAALSGTG